MSCPQAYLMEAPEEGERLEKKTEAVVTERLLNLAGLSNGMRALDAGAGTGAVARVMARLVGPSGSVVALDRSPDRLEYGRGRAKDDGLGNIEFACGDLQCGPIPGAPYDFIWCRFVFEYLADPDRALDLLVRSTRVGGKVVVADLDGNAVFHYPCAPDIREGLDRVLSTLEGQFDPYAGRKLYNRFRMRGLSEINVHVEPYHVYAGHMPSAALENWQQKLRTIRPAAAAAFGSDTAYDAWAQKFLGLLCDEDAFTYSVLVMVHGIRAM